MEPVHAEYVMFSFSQLLLLPLSFVTVEETEVLGCEVISHIPTGCQGPSGGLLAPCPAPLRCKSKSGPSNPASERAPRGSESRTQAFICAPVFIHYSQQQVNKRRKRLRRALTDEWINKTSSDTTVQYYSALKREDILTPDPAPVNLEDRILS